MFYTFDMMHKGIPYHYLVSCLSIISFGAFDFVFIPLCLRLITNCSRLISESAWAVERFDDKASKRN